LDFRVRKKRNGFKKYIDYVSMALSFICCFIFFFEFALASIQPLAGGSSSSTFYITKTAGNAVAFNNSNLPGTETEIVPTTVWGDTSGNIYYGTVTGIIEKVEANSLKAKTVLALGNCSDDTLSKIWGDSVGNIYYVLQFSCAVGKIPAGTTENIIVAGVRWSCGYNGDHIPGDVAMLNSPTSIWGDSTGNLLVTDTSNFRVRRLSYLTAEITTIAGAGNVPVLTDEVLNATETGLYGPSGIAGDSNGNIYFTDGNLIRYVSILDGKLRTVAGKGSDPRENIPIASAAIVSPAMLWIDEVNSICYFVDQLSQFRPFRVSRFSLPDGVVSIVAGSAYGFGGENVPAASAEIGFASDIWADSSGTVYIAEWDFYRIRMVASGKLSTFAGNGFYSYSGDGGPATSALLGVVGGIWTDSFGVLYFTDLENCRIRTVNTKGIIISVGGTGSVCGYNGDNHLLSLTRLKSPGGIWGDSKGNLYFADSNLIRTSHLSGAVTTIAGGGNSHSDSIPAVNSVLSEGRFDIWGDSVSSLYINDYNNSVIRVINLNTSTIYTVAGVFGNYEYSGNSLLANQSILLSSIGIWGNTNGAIFFVEDCPVMTESGDISTRIRKIENGLISSVVENCTELTYYASVVGDTFGTLFVVEQRSYTVQLINATTNIVTSIIGGGTAIVTGVQSATTVTAGYPTKLWIDSQSNLYFDSSDDNAVRSILYKVSSNINNLLSESSTPTSQPNMKPHLNSSSSSTPTSQPTFKPHLNTSSFILLIEIIIPVGVTCVLFGLCIILWIRKTSSKSGRIYAGSDFEDLDNCGLPILPWNRIDVDPAFCGQYAILGQGSFGTVVRANMKESNQRVAVKVVTKSRSFHLNRSYEVNRFSLRVFLYDFNPNLL
jgi:sugar lactone lactonase YvrE